MPGPGRLATLLTAGACAALGWVAVADAAPAESSPRAVGDLWEGNVDLEKVSSDLLSARRLSHPRMPDIDIGAGDGPVELVGGMAVVDVSLDVLTPGIVAQLEAAGLVVEFASYEYARVSGRLPLDRLDEVAAVDEVATIHPEYGAVANAGSVANQADVSMGSSVARVVYGVDGTGVTVGVLSDSFYGGFDTPIVAGSGCSRTVTGMANQVSGDLPASVVVLDNGTLGSGEGAGMAELIHDVAPGAAIQFHTADPSQAAFAAGITELRGCGADVIVDDITYFAAPMFQDGVIAQAARDAVLAGVSFFSSAGNNGRLGVDQVYDDVDPNKGGQGAWGEPTGADFHRFAGGDEFAAITMDLGERFIAVLQWAEPFDGALGAGASTDLNLHLYKNLADVGASSYYGIGHSNTRQGCSVGPGDPKGDPLEVLEYLNTEGNNTTFYLAVDRRCGTADVRFRILIFPRGPIDGIVWESSVFKDAQIHGHPAAEGALAVAAVDFCEVDTNGSFQGAPSVIDVEPFTALGGAIPIYFDRTGTPIPGGPYYRVKPEITAPDGSNTTFFGGTHASGCGEDDGVPSFFGTSASAPHAAAVAALMLDLEPTLTPASVGTILRTTATDIGAVGFDSLSGDGLINALAALGEMPLLDFGDAPDPYPTRRVADGARHVQDDLLYLGAVVDTEADGRPDPAATGDDLADTADEDGVVFTSSVVGGSPAAVEVTASKGGVLNAWVDFNRDGDWDDPLEHIFTDGALPAGVSTLVFATPRSVSQGLSFARFRFDSNGGLAPTGWAGDGEVEDYAVYLYPYLPFDPPSPVNPVDGFTTVFAAPGETACTDHLGNGATAGVPIETCVTSPNAGFVEVLPGPPDGLEGFTMLGTGVLITAPNATRENPLILRFLIDPSVIPPWAEPGSITVFKDGTEVPGCAGAAGVASPDPCVVSQEMLAGGDVEITMLSSAVSLWSFGVAPPACRGLPATIVGDDGPNLLRGTAGDDVIWAGPGDDVVLGRGGNDIICLGSGDDEARGGKGRDRVYGHAGADTIYGGPLRDILIGGRGGDTLYGNRGRDVLRGNKGADTGDGGPGTDRCVGVETATNCEL